MTAAPQYRSIFTQFLEYTQHKNIPNGRTLHAHIIKTGSTHCSYIANSLVNFYAKCHLLPEAHRAFETIEHKDVVSWNSLINGYSQLGGQQNSIIVMHLFKKMMGQEPLVLPDARTFAGAFTAASALGDSFGGKQAHTVAFKLGRCEDIFVGSSLLNMYCKAGFVEDARKVFDEMPERNSISWATMISGYAMQRICGEALGLFKEVVAHEEEHLNEFVVTSILSAFTLPEFIDIGSQIHCLGVKHGLLSHVSVGNAIVTMYSKCGNLDEASVVKLVMVMWEFEKRKAATLGRMSSSEADKSPKGDIDAPLIPLLETLNAHPSYFTTSSCSGRISILQTPIQNPIQSSTQKKKKKANGGGWLFISHEPADPSSLQNLLFPPTPNPTTAAPPQNLVFRFEPFIIALECKDLLSAQNLLALAVSCGFRESGITNVSNKRLILAVRCSIRLEVPLGDTHNIMVSKDYITYLVQIANDKMEANRKRTDTFHHALLKNHPIARPQITAPTADHDFLNSIQDSAHQHCSMIAAEPEDIQLTRDDTRVPELVLRIKPMVISGEPVEKLHLWGHSTCTLETTKNPKSVLVFGGFGGIGRHARRKDSWLLDTASGQIQLVDCSSTPSPRLGHTASLAGELMFVIGGRADPGNVLNDVWVLNTTNNEWKQAQCTGIEFPHSHRHASALIGSSLYVFGGIHNGSISSGMYRLDTQSLKWEEVIVQGQKPSPRHSHTLVAYGSQLFMFGGYDGVKALADFYSFDIHSCTWKKEKTAGSTPHARFSHMMFVYKNYIGIMGGCPIKQHHQDLSIFKVGSSVWKCVKLNSIGEDLFVRSTTSVVGDDLVIVGGGASCYAFGTKFNEPMKLNLLSLVSLAEPFKESKNQSNPLIDKRSNVGFDLNLEGLYDKKMIPLRWVLRVDKKHAKPAKDILKKFGWLDAERKVYTHENGVHVCFPITKEFVALYQNTKPHLNEAVGLVNNLTSQEIFKIASSVRALELLAALGVTTHADHVVKIRKASCSPLKVMKEAVASLLNRHNLPTTLLEQLPTRWERLGDIVVLPITAFKDSEWDLLGNELWLTVADSLGASRLARQGRVSPTGTRDSGLEILVGVNGWVDHRENGVFYSFDATKCMFSWGNLSEKRRMGQLDCKEEVIVDLFAGIGYFTLPFLVKANAKMVYACEWNPHAIEALRRNLEANGVADRCVVLEGDNRVTAPRGVANRVNLGLLPSSEGSWGTAVRALRSKGGMLHVHGNVKDSEEDSWTGQVSKSIKEISRTEGYSWDVSVEHVERVKWYAPHIRHLVVDIKCKQIES